MFRAIFCSVGILLAQGMPVVEQNGQNNIGPAGGEGVEIDGGGVEASTVSVDAPKELEGEEGVDDEVGVTADVASEQNNLEQKLDDGGYLLGADGLRTKKTDAGEDTRFIGDPSVYSTSEMEAERHRRDFLQSMLTDEDGVWTKRLDYFSCSGKTADAELGESAKVYQFQETCNNVKYRFAGRRLGQEKFWHSAYGVAPYMTADAVENGLASRGPCKFYMRAVLLSEQVPIREKANPYSDFRRIIGWQTHQHTALQIIEQCAHGEGYTWSLGYRATWMNNDKVWFPSYVSQWGIKGGEGHFFQFDGWQTPWGHQNDHGDNLYNDAFLLLLPGQRVEFATPAFEITLAERQLKKKLANKIFEKNDKNQ